MSNAMPGLSSKRYVLGSYRLEPDGELSGAGGRSVRLSRKPCQVLLYLIEHRERFVSSAELLERFWGGKDVYDDTVRKCVSTIRKAFDDHSDEPRYIETRWGYGYHYIGPVEEPSPQDAPPADESSQALRPVAAAPAGHLSPARHARLLGRSLLLLGLLLASMLAVFLIVQRGRHQPAAARPHSSPPSPHSVAVLPLKNLTADSANDYLCDGLTESLINALTQIRGLKVIARGSAFSFKGQDIDPQGLRQQLGVATVLQGGVFKDGERLRVEVRLVSTDDGRVLWAGAPYDRKLGDILALQDEIARNVVGGLAYKLSAEEERRLTVRHTASVEAYQAYLKGRYQWYKRSKEGLNQSLEYFQAARKLDPNYAQAYVGIADYYNMGVWFLLLSPQEAMTKAKAAAQRALALDNGLADAHLSLARAYLLEWKWADGLRETEHVLEIDPGNAEAHHIYAYDLLLTGQADRAVAEMQQAREFDPLSVVMNVDVGEVLLYARRYDEAVAALRHALELDPNRVNAHWDLARALQMQGAEGEAFEEYVRTATLGGDPPAAISAFREAYNGAGLRGFWQKRLELELEQARHEYVPPYSLAWHYAQLGDRDRAFACLEQAYRAHLPNMIDLRFDPLLDPLHADPRFAQLAARVGL